MNAGLLKTKISFYKPVDILSDSGSSNVNYVLDFITRCFKKDSKGSYRIENYESTLTEIITVVVRFNHNLKSTHIAELGDYRYKITHLDKSQYDKSITLTLTKINN